MQGLMSNEAVRLGIWAFAVLAGACSADSGTMTPDRGMNDEGFVGRWVGSTSPTDLHFAEGRPVRLDETLEMRADGVMLGDFAGFDDATRCVSSYHLEGRWALGEGDVIDVGWTSVVTETFGCLDAGLDEAPTDVTASEGDLWDEELDGTWTVVGDRLTVAAPAGVIEYRRATDPRLGRWVGTNAVDDLHFLEPGETVDFEEQLWVGHDGTIRSALFGLHDASGCFADYRITGRWTPAGDAVSVQWLQVSTATFDCEDPAFDEAPTDVTAEEAAMWEDETGGTWTVVGADLRIDNRAGGSVAYRRAL